MSSTRQPIETGPEFLYAVVDLSTDSTTVFSRACLLRAVYINTVLSNHVCLIKDGAAVAIRIPAEATAGSKIDFGDMRLETSLVVDPDDAATGEILIVYKPIEEGLTVYPTLR
jgi:hypothetical protein